jgi:NTE family protein
MNGKEVVIGTGDLIEAVRASISVPGILTPVRSDGRILVDGGLVNPVPVSTVRAMGADLVIAVDLNHDIVASRLSPPNSLANGKLYANAVTRMLESLQSIESPALSQVQCMVTQGTTTGDIRRTAGLYIHYASTHHTC